MRTPKQTEPDPAPASGDEYQSLADHASPQTGDELTARNVRMIVELERQAKASLTRGERLAVRIAAFFGSTTFVLIHCVWFGAWIFVNTSSLFTHHPDPFPFSFLSFIVALEAIFLSAFILISQNHEVRLNVQRSQLDLQVNLLIEQENTRMLRLLRSIAAKVGAEIEDDLHLSALEEATDPERVLDQLDKATASTRGDS